MEIRGFWWVLLLLLLLLLDRQSSGTANIPAQNPRRYQVSGIQGGSVLLPIILTSSEKVDRIEWKFQPQTGLDLGIAEFTGGKLKRLNPGNRFGQRLERADEATLRITELELGDSGLYVAQVRLASAVVEEHSFTCWVYGKEWLSRDQDRHWVPCTVASSCRTETSFLFSTEPVPEPQIFHRLVSRTAEVCNVTLKCLGSERGGIKVSWKRGNQPGVLEEVPGSDRLSANSTDLHVSWQPDSMDSTFTCLLSNSINQKSASLDLASICRSEGESHKDLNASPKGVSPRAHLGQGPAPAEVNLMPQSTPDTLQENL
uniref:Uncharacterized protein n=1 Tax=Sphaerodactylus townsendi TaxID=933632 RepID=A0ACB8G6E0_9SAUR